MNVKQHFTGRICAIGLCCAAAGVLLAQTMDVPVDVQIPLFSKILTYDRNLSARMGDRIVLGILYQHTNKGSTTVKDDFLKTLSDTRLTTMGGIPFTVELIDLAGTAEVAAALDARGVTVAYITPLRAYEVETICEIARQRKILTLTGVNGYADRGVSIAIGIQSRRPEILINLPSAKAEGAEFNSHFLKLVKVLQ